MDSHPKLVLRSFLDRYFSEKSRAAVLGGVLAFLAAAAGGLGFISILSLIGSNPFYLSFLKIIYLMGFVLCIYRFLVLPALNREPRSDIIEDFDKVHRGIGEDILSGLELMEQREAGKSTGVSEDLVDAQIQVVSGSLENEDIKTAVSLERLRRYFAPLAVSVVLSTLALFFTGPEFRSFFFSTRLVPLTGHAALELADISITYKYPQYSRIPQQTVLGTTGDVKALMGTQVTLRAVPLRAVGNLELVLSSGLRVSVSREGGSIEGSFTVLSDGSYFIRDSLGARTRNFAVTAEKDRFPSVKISSPNTEDILDIKGEESIDIEYETADDFGHTAIYLLSRSEHGEYIKLLSELAEEPQRFGGSVKIDLYSVPGQPGEVFEVGVMAYDNDGVSGPKAGISNTIRIRVKDRRQEHRDIVELAEVLFEQLLETLADDIEFRPDTLAAAIDYQAVRETQGDITVKIQGAYATLEALIDNMKGDDYSDYTYFIGLSNMLSRIDEILEDRNETSSLFSPAGIGRFDGRVTREINEFEDDVLFLDSMIKSEMIRDSLLYGQDMASGYEELSELLKKLKEGVDEETLKAIERKIAELKELMAQMAQKLASLNSSIPEGHLNPEAFKTVNVSEQLDEMMKLIEEGRLDEALSMLGDMESQMQDMMAALQSGAQSFASASLSGGIMTLNNIVSRIEKLEEAESELKQNTESLMDSLLKNREGAERDDSAAKKDMRKLADRQDKIERETYELAGECNNPSAGAVLPGELGKELGEASRYMAGASENLSEAEISKGISNESEALEALRRAKASAKGLLEQLKMSSMGRGQSVPFVLGGRNRRHGMIGVDTGYVEIPQAAEPVVGKELKESLLKALRDGSPEGFDELNRKYYERIIK
ncbi:MAG: DUF4175 family protein [Thermodesulfobacteriota bacterium]